MKKECPLIKKILFDLLKVSLWNTFPQIDYDRLTYEEWREVYHLSSKQGVRSLVFGGVSKLPENMQPHENLLLAWAANTILAKEKHLRNQNTVIRLNERCATEGLELLLLKGCALANCYPIPEYREYGDIDIYLLGKHSEGDSFLRKQGDFMKEMEKHTTFVFEGIPVENHKTFTDQIKYTDIFCKKRKRDFEYIEKQLHEILMEDQRSYLNHYDIRIPSATFNFLFIIMHTGTHLGKELVIRHVCDWACFLVSNKGEYDEKRIEQTLDKLNLRLLCMVMTDVAICHLGMSVEFAPSFYKEGDRERISAKFVNSLFEHFPGSKEVEKNTLSCKWQRFYHNQWAYDLFEKEYLPERLCRALVVCIKDKYKKRRIFKNNIN